jgi:epoxyqueuosine reductase
LTSNAESISRETIALWASELGFADIGITNVDLTAYEPHVRNWLAQGFAGEMGYLERNVEKRLNPALLEPGTCRVITARMDYLVPDTKPIEILEDSSKAYVSRYALGRDYHKVLRRRLAKLAARINERLPGQYRAFTDSAPVLEKALAEKSGLGWIGKHTLLLTEEAGSWFFLGEIYTNAPLPLDDKRPDTGAGCGKCTACMTVCPTDAILAPNRLDARRCISYLTIEHKGAIDPALRPLMGNRIYGCDDCQLFCPWNRNVPATAEEDFAVRHQLDSADLLDLFELNEDEFDLLTQGSAMRRIGYEQWQRNVAIAIGNGPASKRAEDALQKRLASASPLVAEHIRWALDQLSAS